MPYIRQLRMQIGIIVSNIKCKNLILTELNQKTGKIFFFFYKNTETKTESSFIPKTWLTILYFPY